MIPVVWILALNALCVPAAIVLQRFWLRAHPVRADLPAQGSAARCTLVSCLALWLAGSIGGFSWGFPALLPIFHGIFLGAQGLVYIAVFCVSESGRRYYLLEQLDRQPGITPEALAATYPDRDILERRLARLLAWGVISRRDDRCRLQKRSSYYYSLFFRLWGKCLGFTWFRELRAGHSSMKK